MLAKKLREEKKEETPATSKASMMRSTAWMVTRAETVWTKPPGKEIDCVRNEDLREGWLYMPGGFGLSPGQVYAKIGLDEVKICFPGIVLVGIKLFQDLY